MPPIKLSDEQRALVDADGAHVRRGLPGGRQDPRDRRPVPAPETEEPRKGIALCRSRTPRSTRLEAAAANGPTRCWRRTSSARSTASSTGSLPAAVRPAVRQDSALQRVMGRLALASFRLSATWTQSCRVPAGLVRARLVLRATLKSEVVRPWQQPVVLAPASSPPGGAKPRKRPPERCRSWSAAGSSAARPPGLLRRAT